MKESFKATLKINKISVDMNPFVEEFLARIAAGAVSALRGAEDTRRLEIHQEKGAVKIVANGDDIPLTPFPNQIICSTLVGLVSTLKGVGEVDSLDISVTVQ